MGKKMGKKMGKMGGGRMGRGMSKGMSRGMSKPMSRPMARRSMSSSRPMGKSMSRPKAMGRSMGRSMGGGGMGRAMAKRRAARAYARMGANARKIRRKTGVNKSRARKFAMSLGKGSYMGKKVKDKQPGVGHFKMVNRKDPLQKQDKKTIKKWEKGQGRKGGGTKVIGGSKNRGSKGKGKGAGGGGGGAGADWRQALANAMGNNNFEFSPLDLSGFMEGGMPQFGGEYGFGDMANFDAFGIPYINPDEASFYDEYAMEEGMYPEEFWMDEAMPMMEEMLAEFEVPAPTGQYGGGDVGGSATGVVLGGRRRPNSFGTWALNRQAGELALQPRFNLTQLGINA